MARRVQCFRAPGHRPVHIFLRAYSPESVLIRQEVPLLRVIQALNPAVKLHWHPVYTTADGKLMEVTDRLELAPNSFYSSRDKCVAVLYNYLRLKHDPANGRAGSAYEDMNRRLTANGFPQDGKPTSG